MTQEFNLARLVVSLVANDSQLTASIDGMRQRMQQAQQTGDRLGQFFVGNQMAAAGNSVGQLQAAFGRLSGTVSNLVGVNLPALGSTLAAFASGPAFAAVTGVRLLVDGLARLVTYLQEATWKAIGVEDKASITRATLRALGLEADSTAAAFGRFADAMARKTTLNKGEINDLAIMAVRLGVNKDKALDFAQTAIGLSARLNIDPETALRALERAASGKGEGGRALIALSPEIRDAAKHGRDLNEIVARLSREGFDIWNAKVGTVGGQLAQLKKESDGLTTALGRIFAPVVTPVIREMVAILQQFAAAAREVAVAVGFNLKNELSGLGDVAAVALQPFRMAADVFRNFAYMVRQMILDFQLMEIQVMRAADAVNRLFGGQGLVKRNGPDDDPFATATAENARKRGQAAMEFFNPAGAGGEPGAPGRLGVVNAKPQITGVQEYIHRLQLSAASGQTPAQKAEQQRKQQIDEQRKTNEKLNILVGVMQGAVGALQKQPKPGTLPT